MSYYIHLPIFQPPNPNLLSCRLRTVLAIYARRRNTRIADANRDGGWLKISTITRDDDGPITLCEIGGISNKALDFLLFPIQLNALDLSTGGCEKRTTDTIDLDASLSAHDTLGLTTLLSIDYEGVPFMSISKMKGELQQSDSSDRIFLFKLPGVRHSQFLFYVNLEKGIRKSSPIPLESIQILIN